MNRETRLKRLRFRAWHRGTREADLMIGGFFDARSAGWNDAAIAWFEVLMDEQDVDVMTWAMGRATPPSHLAGTMMDDLRRLDFVPIA